MKKIYLIFFLIATVLCENSKWIDVESNTNLKINFFPVRGLTKFSFPIKDLDLITIDNFNYRYSGEKKIAIETVSGYLAINQKMIFDISHEKRKYHIVNGIMKFKPFEKISLNLENKSAFLVKILDLSNTTVYSFQKLKNFTNLTSLNLSSTNITDKDLVNISQIKTLKHLDLSNTQITSKGLLHLKDLIQLESLVLENTNIDDEALIHLAHLDNLRYLSLVGDKIVGHGLEYITSLKNLLFLNFVSLNFSFDFKYTKFLSMFHQLVYLYFQGNHRNYHFNFSILKNLGNLYYFICGNKINYDETEFLQGSKIQYLRIYNIPKSIAHIENLNFVSCVNLSLFLSNKSITDANKVYNRKQELENIAHLHSLKVLCVEGDMFFLEIFENVKNLESLCLYLGKVKNDVIKNFIGNKKLKGLVLMYCDVENNSLAWIKNFQYLESLTIYSKNFGTAIDQIEDIENIISLENITIIGDMTNNLFQKIAKLPRLCCLELRLAKINYKAFDSIEQSNIKMLDLSTCRNIDDKCGERIVTMKSLQYVNVKDTLITKKVTKFLKLKHPTSKIYFDLE